MKLNEAAINVLKTMALLSTAFCLCTIPNGVWYLLYELNVKGATVDSTFYHFTVIAEFCNCCINPFLYSFQYREFQKAAKMLLCGCKYDGQKNNTSQCLTPTSVSSEMQ